MDLMTTRTLQKIDIDSMLRAGAEAVASLVGATTEIAASANTISDVFTTRAVVVDGATIVFGLAISDESRLEFSNAILPDGEPDDAAVASAVEAIASQFFDAIGELVGDELTEVAPEPFDVVWSITLGAAVIEVGVVSIPIAPPVPASPTGSRLSGVRLDVSVELGRARIPVKELLALDEGGVIRLGRPVGEPVDLVVNGTVTARGEIVVVDGRLGLRITSLV
jgi:flagellar motor switch protein FliN/FliY